MMADCGHRPGERSEWPPLSQHESTSPWHLGPNQRNKKELSATVDPLQPALTPINRTEVDPGKNAMRTVVKELKVFYADYLCRRSMIL